MKHTPTKCTPAGKRKQREAHDKEEVRPPGTTVMDPTETISVDPNADICSELMKRYSASSAPQHRHLIATAAAMKAILLEDSLPPSPLSYFAAAITALSLPHRNDADSSSALATLLSIVLPLIPEGSISPEKAVEAVGILVRVLSESNVNAKCVVKCLGVLVGFCDLRDWDSVKVPFETLLNWSIDKRPKVRKCAIVYLENSLKSFKSNSVKKNASKLVLSLLESYMPLAVKLDAPRSGEGSEADNSDVSHVLNVMTVAIPYLPEKISVKVVLKLVGLLNAHFSTITRPILNAIGEFLEKVEVEVINEVASNIVDALSSFLSSKKNPKDSVIAAANSLKNALDKIHVGDTDKWHKSLPLVVKAIAGLLTREDEIASEASNVLKNLIDQQFSGIDSQLVSYVVENVTESNAITSVCSIFMNLLDDCSGIPNEHTLTVISLLFLKLGGKSSFYMRNIVLKLAEIFIHADVNESDYLQKCVGCAVVAMGPENVLGIVPISLSNPNMICSNVWLLPILKKYIFGASLGYFMEHIVPIAETLQRASSKVKKSVIAQDLQAHARALWGLLPAFCRHPTDISQSFQSLTKLLLVKLEKDTSLHEDIAFALQELVNQNKCVSKFDHTSGESIEHSSDLIERCLSEKRSMCCYSKKVVSKNIKALSTYSHEILQALMTVFLASPPDKRSSLKKPISSLSSISDSSITKKIFISSLERFPVVKAVAESGEFDLSNESLNDTPCDTNSTSDGSQWCLILNLASSIVEGADEELVSLIFGLTKHALQAGDEIGVSEAYHTLSCVLEEHPWFCSSKMDELVDLLIGLKSPADVASLSNRLSSLHILFVHALKSSSDVDNTRPFLILNEIILALKDSKEEARKTAYDMLLRISSSLGGSSSANPDGPYHKLISMILGYVSGPSPHTTSAAISALSVLVFKEPELCLTVSDVVPSVTSLLQTKAVEVIKAVLGFIKVLVSCLETKDLHNFLPVILDGVLPWSSVSRHHFRSKVTVILEIMIRKCGYPAIKSVTSDKYQSFIRKVAQSRHGKTNSKEADSNGAKPQLSDVSRNGQKKRLYNETSNEGSGSTIHRKKRMMQKQDSRSPGGAGTHVVRKTNRFKHNNPRLGDQPGKLNPTRRESFGQASGKHSKRHGSKNSRQKR